MRPDTSKAGAGPGSVVQRFDAFSRGVSVVSFDAFDTLLERPLDRPTDVFSLVSDRIEALLGFASLDYRAERVSAEATARIAIGDDLDPGVPEIAAQLAASLGVDRPAADRALELELELERKLLRARPDGRALFARARELGLRIYVTSDTRFDAGTLESLLRGAGYSGEIDVLTSADRRATKRTGELFDRLIARSGVSPAAILHVGDHAIADVERAHERGLRSMHLPRVELPYFDSAGFERVYGRHGERLDLGTRARQTVAARAISFRAPDDDSQFGGDPYLLGFLGLGPLLLGFTNDLLDRASAHGISRLFFLSRDGRLLHRAYERLSATRPDAPEATYLLCSRRAANVANLRTVADVLSCIASLRALGSVRDLIERRLGLPVDRIPASVLASAGLDVDERVGEAGRERLVSLARALAPQILENAAVERDAYRSYLAALGLRATDSHAVVDLGYSCTMQIALDSLAEGEGGLRGYYLLTYRSARALLRKRGLSASAYVGDFVERDDPHLPFARHVSLFEALFLGDEDSLVRMRTEGDEPAPEFLARSRGELSGRDVIERIQEGALAFVERCAEEFRATPTILDLAPSRATLALDVFFDDPAPRDAAILATLRFEDHYAAAGVRPLVDTGRGPNLWPEGKLALGLGERPSTSVRNALTNVDWSGGRLAKLTPFVAPIVGPLIDRLADRVLSETKLDKFRREPRRFFADSSSAAGRALGRLHSHHRRRKDLDRP